MEGHANFAVLQPYLYPLPSAAGTWSTVRRARMTGTTVRPPPLQPCQSPRSIPPALPPVLQGVTKAIGNGLSKETWVQFQKRFGIEYVGEFYGSTEGNASLTCVHFIKSPAGAVGYIPWIAKFFYPVKIVRFSHDLGTPIRDTRGQTLCQPIFRFFSLIMLLFWNT